MPVHRTLVALLFIGLAASTHACGDSSPIVLNLAPGASSTDASASANLPVAVPSSPASADADALEDASPSSFDGGIPSAPADAGMDADAGALGRAGILSAIYLVPDGETANAGQLAFFRDAVPYIRDWYMLRLGRTFDFALGTVAGTHPRAWLDCAATNPTPTPCFAKVTQQLAELNFDLWAPNTDYLVAVQGNENAYAGAQAQNGSGFAIVSADSFNQLVVQNCAPAACTTGGADGDGVTGGIAHELGHTFGLPHPPDDVANRPWSVMAEHWHFPNNGFLPSEMPTLQAVSLLH